MTEKRFQYNVNKNSIEYNEKHFAYYNGEQNKIANKLNELAEENDNITLLAQHNYEESKRIINRYVDKIKELKKKNKELKAENEQLKQLLLQFYTEDEINAELI